VVAPAAILIHIGGAVVAIVKTETPVQATTHVIIVDLLNHKK
jgi:hypothetical protein